MGLLKSHGSADERRVWRGEFPVQSLYTAGVAGQKFFTALRDDGKILASRCEKCSTTTLLPRAFCERCLGPTHDYPEVVAACAVRSWTVLRRDLDDRKMEEPEILALIGYDGVEGGIVHKLREIGPESVKVGLPVEAVFRPAAEREGSILDISHFRPSGAG